MLARFWGNLGYFLLVLIGLGCIVSQPTDHSWRLVGFYNGGSFSPRAGWLVA